MHVRMFLKLVVIPTPDCSHCMRCHRAECRHSTPNSNGRPIMTVLIVCNCAQTSGQDCPIREICNKLWGISRDMIMIDLICVARLMTLLCRSTAERQVVLPIFTPWQLSTRLSGVTSQQTQIFTVITLKTSNLTQLDSTVRSLHRFKIIQTKRPRLLSSFSAFYHEDGDRKFLQNVSAFLPDTKLH